MVNIYGKEWYRRRPLCKDCVNQILNHSCEHLDDHISFLREKCIFKEWRVWFDKKEVMKK